MIGKKFKTTAGYIFTVNNIIPEVRESLGKNHEELYDITFEDGFHDIIGKSYLINLEEVK